MDFINNGQGNNKDATNITCWNCWKKGHYENECPDKKTETDTDADASRQSGSATGTNGIRDAIVMLQEGVHGGEFDGDDMFSAFSFFNVGHEPMQTEEEHTQIERQSVVLSQRIQDSSNAGFINNSWILLKNQPTVHVFSEHRLLKDIRKIDSWVDIHCNDGVTSTHWVGDLPGVGRVWYHPNGIANILSLSKTANQFRINYDSWGRNAFEVHKLAVDIQPFVESTHGLFYMDTNNYHVEAALANTVADTKSSYSVADYSHAKRARYLQYKIGKHSMVEFIKIVENNLLINCPISKDDKNIAEDIWRPNLGSLKGKNLRQQPIQVRDSVLPIPLSISQKYKHINLCADVMKVNNNNFFLSIYKHLYLHTVEFIEGQKANHFMMAMKNINTLYRSCEFQIAQANMDGKFEPICAGLLGLCITLNTVSRDEHIPEAERNVITVKYRVQSVLTTPPFSKVPDHMIIEIVLGQVFWLNVFPNKYGVSKTMIPHQIMSGLKID